jgi:hypothetical protein
MRVAPPPLFRPLQPLFTPSVASVFADAQFHATAATAAIFSVFALCRPLPFRYFFLLPFPTFAVFRFPFSVPLLSPIFQYRNCKLCRKNCVKNDVIILICNVLHFAKNTQKSAKKTLIF